MFSGRVTPDEFAITEQMNEEDSFVREIREDIKTLD